MKRKRFVTEKETDTGWSRWLPPDPNNYLMACCDCGLVHRMQFRAIKITKRKANGYYTYEVLGPSTHQVLFRAQRAPNHTKRQRKSASVAAEEGK